MLQKFTGDDFANAIGLTDRIQIVRSALGHEGLSPTKLREAAALALISGDRDAAVSMLEAATAFPTDAGNGWFCLGLLAIAERRFDEALQYLRSAVRGRFQLGLETEQALHQLESIDLEKNRYFIFEIFYDAFPNDFCIFVTFEEVNTSERQGYTFCFARTISHLGTGPGLRPLLERDLTLNGPSVWHWVAIGKIEWLHGDKTAADAAFRSARELSMEWRVTPYHFDCGVMGWLTRNEAQELLTQQEPEKPTLTLDTFKFEGSDSGGPVDIAFVVGCDAGYFRFVPNFIFSLVRARRASGSSARAVVHCHIADPDTGQLQFLRDASAFLEKHALGISISISSSEATFREPAYYTCLRFLILPEVLKHFRCGAIAVDIDSMISEGFFQNLELIKSHAFGFRAYTFPSNARRAVNGEPWSIGAHPTFVNYSEQGMEFASFLQHYVKTAYDPAFLTNWCVDQCAIGRAFDLLIAENTGTSFVNFAHLAGLYGLPDGAGKDAFLVAHGGISSTNFYDMVNSLLTSHI